MTTDILIVEDHPTMRGAMRAVLEQESFVLREAANGTEAFEAINERQPDLMFLDLNIPGMSGEQILQAVKNEPTTAGIRIIIVTALGQDARERVLALGADEFFMKPFSPMGILQTVERVMATEPAKPAKPQDQSAET
jgi:CheY-like chemotaxis protein